LLSQVGDECSEPTQGLDVASIEDNGKTNKIQNQNTDWNAVLLLNLVAVIWGTQHSVIKMVVDECDASAFSFSRFAIAAIIASSFTPSFPSLKDNIFSDQVVSENTLAWRWGLEMGTWMFLGYAFQAIGLEFTTAQRSGFLLYLNVKFVPFLGRLLFGRKISMATWLSALTALMGTALLSCNGSTISLNVGDLWSVLAAAASAMFILRLETASASVKNSSALNATSLWTVTVASLIWTIGESIQSGVDSNMDGSIFSTDRLMEVTQISILNVLKVLQTHPLELLYLGGATTAFANYIQTKAQGRISAERASIIYALDPVYGAFFAYIFLGEELSQYGVAGAALITIAAATNALLDLGVKDNMEIETNDSDNELIQ
jgi:drug/metabolite transporter (DMT)-like permease